MKQSRSVCTSSRASSRARSAHANTSARDSTGVERLHIDRDTRFQRRALRAPVTGATSRSITHPPPLCRAVARAASSALCVDASRAAARGLECRPAWAKGPFAALVPKRAAAARGNWHRGPWPAASSAMDPAADFRPRERGGCGLRSYHGLRQQCCAEINGGNDPAIDAGMAVRLVVAPGSGLLRRARPSFGRGGAGGFVLAKTRATSSLPKMRPTSSGCGVCRTRRRL